MNNKIISCLLLGGLVFMSSCGKQKVDPTPKPEDNPPENQLCSYESIYDGKSKERHDVVYKLTDFNRASYGYRFNEGIQGYNNWRFVKQDENAFVDLVYENGSWVSESDSFTDGIFNTSSSSKLGFIYTIVQAGTYSFGGTFAPKNLQNTAKLEVFVNKTLVHEEEITAADVDGKYFEMSQSLNLNDELVFLVNGQGAYFNPAVAQGESMVQSLYDPQNEWGYYGDIHCYYYNNLLYMFHLLDAPQWAWFCKTTTDMFRFYDSGYDDSFVENHYMAYGKRPDVLDYNQYKSARDCTYFFDEDVQKYRCIGLGYRKDGGDQISCDLFLRTSSDSMGFEWNEPAIALRTFPLTSDGEPECSQLIKIDKRWYLTAGISGQSIHGVGTCSYWIGEEGKTIDEINWSTLPTHKLDGEDLSVPQIEKVKDRHYFFGWTPRTYNSNKWGGFKNLSREVFVREDGTLGTRIDEMATKLLNKGKLFNVDNSVIESMSDECSFDGTSFVFDSAGEVVFNKQINHVFNKYHVKMNGANLVSYKMYGSSSIQPNISIQKKDDGTYLEVKHTNGFVSSNVYLGPLSLNEFDVKLVVDDNRVEFAVNDSIVLTAITMNTSNYRPAFATDGSAEITNVSFNRLAQFYDVYD